MEPFTHAFTSLALARAGQKRLPRFGTAMLIVSGIAPDLDYASYLGGAHAFMRLHRTALHSVAGSALMACAIAGAFCALDKKLPPEKSPRARALAPLAFGPALAVCAVGAASHILLDLVSGAGVQLLWPFWTHWSAANLANDFDLWILLLLVAGLLLPLLFRLVSEEVGERKKGPGGSRAAIVTLFLVVTYLGARGYLHSQAIDLLLSREYHGRVPLTAGAFPVSSAPFEWRGLVVTDDTIEEVEVPLGSGDEFSPDRSLTHYKPEDSPALDIGEKTAAARRFLAYAQFPLASVQRLEAGYRVEVRDLRFASGDTGPANIFVRVDLDSALQVRHEDYLFASSPNP
ncbi:MAG TPA: metal-dependent hydrolase [Candidatus Acidoferrales bacterium]|nr:metal-dependent hydrolase [Candidatus Acidoferrales bacterium]